MIICPFQPSLRCCAPPSPASSEFRDVVFEDLVFDNNNNNDNNNSNNNNNNKSNNGLKTPRPYLSL